MHFLETITEQAYALHWSEVGAVVFALAYLAWAARNDRRCWIWGGMSCALWAWAAFFLYKLYVDALLQLFYVAVSIWGWYSWGAEGAEQNRSRPITRMHKSEHWAVLLMGSLLSVLTGCLFAHYTDAALPYLDAFTTVFSVLVTFLVVFRKLENWLYWLVIDAVYIYQYSSRGGYLFALLFVVYLVLAIKGYRTWKAELNLS